jgi:hypothetical protein
MKDLPEMIPMKKLEAILKYLDEDPAVYEGIVGYLADEALASDKVYEQLRHDGAFASGENGSSLEIREKRIEQVNKSMIDLGFLDNHIWRKPHNKE